MEMVARQFDVFLMSVNAESSSEDKLKSPRPCLVISPDEMNPYLPTVLVAPLTSRKQDFPTRVSINFKLKSGQIALEQIRVIDKTRLVKRLGRVSGKTQSQVLEILAEMFTR